MQLFIKKHENSYEDLIINQYFQINKIYKNKILRLKKKRLEKLNKRYFSQNNSLNLVFTKKKEKNTQFVSGINLKKTD